MSLFDGMAAATATAVAAVYADDAVFTPTVGSPTTIRIVLAYHDPNITFGGMETQTRSGGREGRVQQALLPARPLQGEGVQVLTGVHVGTYTVRDCFEDLERSEWILDLS